MYAKLKKQNGEKFAQTIRNFHNGILEIPDLDVILRHAGRDAEPLLPYLKGLLSDNNTSPVSTRPDPFALLDEAGYDAFHADTLEKQNSIKHYFAQGELLCTFNDSVRHKDYHIVHAVKKGAAKLHRADFDGKEERQDDYGTSVISIQMLKTNGFIKITNRYNHTVPGSDNTFNSNPDNIIHGLSTALKKHFNVDYAAPESALPDNFVLIDKRIFKYHTEIDNIYYGNGAWAKNGIIHAVDKSVGHTMFDSFLFNNKTKTLEKIDPDSNDSFADDFNRCYGGNKGLNIQGGNLVLNGEIIIGADQSRIKTLYLPALTTMGDYCLVDAHALTHFNAPAITTMGDYCLGNANALMHFNAPALTTIGDYCLGNADALTHFNAPALTTMGNRCLRNAHALTHFHTPALTTVGNFCLGNINTLTHFHAPALTTMGDDCLRNARALTHFHAPALTTVGDDCLLNARALTHFHAPALTTMGNRCLENAALTHFHAPALTMTGTSKAGAIRQSPGYVAMHLSDRPLQNLPS